MDGKRLRNGCMTVPHQPPTVVNDWWRGVGARVVLGLAIVVARCGYLELLSRPEEPNVRGVYLIYAYCFLVF